MSKLAFGIAVGVLLTTMVVLFFTIGFMNDPEGAQHLKDLGATIVAMLVAGIFIPLYFLPAIIAGFRHHHNTVAILVLNVLLGWTALGWIAAIVWSATSVAPARQ